VFKKVKDKFDKPKTVIKKEEQMIPHSTDIDWEDRLKSL
jgi:hypothetical protein